MKRIIIIVLSLAIILGFLFWKFGPSLFSKKDQGPINLTYWGLWEEDNLTKGVLAKFESENPNIKVTYVRQSSLNYRSRLQTQIREGVGPDIFRIHNSWLPMFATDLYPAPGDIFTESEYKTLFYPVALDSFVRGKDIFAAPIEVDGLALFYNEELLSGVGKIPRNWQEFTNTAFKMTVRDPKTGKIQTAGAAMGTSSNVDHWQDIFGLLLLQQPGVNFENLTSDKAAEVLKFYTEFITDPGKKSWDVDLPPSTQMFAQGRLGFYFAPSWRAHELRVANPNLKFKVVPVPQLSSTPKAWATFWGEAVSKNSAHPKEAWKFIKFLTSPDAEKLLYQEAAKIRLFGEPYSRVDLAPEIANDPVVGAFVIQGPIYKFWYLSSNTFDNGINDQIIKYFEDGINSTLSGTNPQVALQTIDKGVKQVLEQYSNKPAVSPK